MKLFADYHTHTRYSDGLGQITDNVRIAKEKGLLQVAITDHSFRHKMFPVLRKQVPLMLREIEKAKNEYNIAVLYGLETNLISRGGDIDLTNEDEKKLDIVLMSFHKHIYAKNIKEWFLFILPNFFGRHFFYTKKRIEINTNAYLKAIEKNKIDVITHLGDSMTVDHIKIARHCAKFGVYLELNGKRNFFKESEMQAIIDTGVQFIVNSDAHKPSYVGECARGIQYVLKYNIPLNQVANLNKLPTFKNHKE